MQQANSNRRLHRRLEKQWLIHYKGVAAARARTMLDFESRLAGNERPYRIIVRSENAHKARCGF
jgi:hypothetical protein